MKKFLLVLVTLMMTSTLVFAGGGRQPAAGSDATPTVYVEVFDRGTDGGRSDPTKNNYTDWIQQKILKDENIRVEFIAIPRSDEVPALNNMMAAGNPPDICLTYDLALIANYRDLGGLFDMGPTINKNMPDLDKFLGEDPMLPGRRFILRSREAQTGSVFSVPARRMNVARINTFIREDWLQKLGLGLPQTTQEFYDAMVAFKTKDPGGVGASRVIPMVSSRGARWNFGNLVDSFIDPNLSIKDEWVNTVVDRSYLLPGYKDGVRFLNKMYNEGLIDRDFPLYRSDDEPFALLKSGVAGSYQHNYDQLYRDSPGVYKDLAANVPGATFVVIDPFRQSLGSKTVKYAYDAAGVYFFIPKTAKFPEAAMRYVNWLARFENNYFLQLGPEGIAWDMVDDIPRVKPAPGLWIQNSPQNIDYTIPINGLELGDETKNMQALANSYNVDPRYIFEAYELCLKNARPLPVIPVTLTAAGPVQQTLLDLGDQLMAEAITCSPGQFDRTWDDGIRNWLASGAEQVRAEREAKFIEP